MRSARILSTVMAVALLACAAWANWAVDFEDGTFGGLLGHDGADPSTQWEIEAADPQGNPHGGLLYAKPTTPVNTHAALRTEGGSLGLGSGQGTLTAWFRVNHSSSDSSAIFQIFGNDQAAFLHYDRNQGKIFYNGGGTGTGAWRWRDDFIGDDAWGKAHAVVDETGMSMYLDDELMGTNDALTSIDSGRFGYNPWISASAYNQIFLDDISWVEAGAPMTGDANRDGVVDDADLSLLLASWSQDRTGDPDGGWGSGEFDGSAPVGDADLSLLLANWTTAGAVPEPATLALLAVGGLVTLARRRR